ncbi:hypothetical protein DFH07DRAFT_781094 [Mycena maculata]|uniref:Uncharacterized protein n=1 Tax=Mycena maculata TaxID=230809 RepID=A0AAD7MV35_9AGAR|nr:hypothetical protein DFH07DRAFT_781094 [Mycena maculata]
MHRGGSVRPLGEAMGQATSRRTVANGGTNLQDIHQHHAYSNFGHGVGTRYIPSPTEICGSTIVAGSTVSPITKNSNSGNAAEPISDGNPGHGASAIVGGKSEGSASRTDSNFADTVDPISDGNRAMAGLPSSRMRRSSNKRTRYSTDNLSESLTVRGQHAAAYCHPKCFSRCQNYNNDVNWRERDHPERKSLKIPLFFWSVGIKEIHQIGCIERWVQIRLVLAVQIQSLGIVAIEKETLVVGIGSSTSLYIFAKFPQQIWLNVVLFITVPYEICFNICNRLKKMLRGQGTQPIMGP